ncbi:MAG: tetratricopeptide repeat protein [Cyanobacteriota bacterium]
MTTPKNEEKKKMSPKKMALYIGLIAIFGLSTPIQKYFQEQKRKQMELEAQQQQQLEQQQLEQQQQQQNGDSGALSGDESDEKTLINKGITHFDREEYQSAKEYFEKVLELNPDEPKSYEFLGKIYLKEGNEDKAIENLRLAGMADPNYYGNFLDLGIIYHKKGMLEPALQFLIKARDLNPTFPDTHIEIANIYLDKGEIETAITNLKTAIQHYPNDPKPYNKIGEIYVSQGDLEQALTYLDQALATDPKFALAYTNKGIIYLKQQKPETKDQAKEMFEKAISLNPEESKAYFYLANYYLMKNNKEQAKLNYMKTLEFDPENEEAAKKIKEIDPNVVLIIGKSKDQ